MFRSHQSYRPAGKASDISIPTKSHQRMAQSGSDRKWSLVPYGRGTPQGGVCSPLLANIALHGLEQEITSAFPALVQTERWKPTVVRYADDLVVLHSDKAVIEQVQQLVSAWLAGMGLALKPSKTRISHTLTPCENHLGVDFLGFRIQQFPVGKTDSGKGRDGQRLGFKTIITPSETAMKRHQEALKEQIK